MHTSYSSKALKEQYLLSNLLSGSCAGIILAYSNSLAGSLSDASVARGHGNIGCFIGGIVATILSGVVLLLFSRFSDLGREDKIVTLKKSRA